MNYVIKDLKYMNKEFYNDIKEILEQARKRVYRNIQSEMVLAYWKIGKMIVEKQGGSPRADYGEGLISELSIQMTKDYGKGFDATNLRKMRQFYMLFPKRATVWRELSWSHHYLISRGQGLLVIDYSKVDEFKKNLVNYYEDKDLVSIKLFLRNCWMRF